MKLGSKKYKMLGFGKQCQRDELVLEETECIDAVYLLGLDVTGGWWRASSRMVPKGCSYRDKGRFKNKAYFNRYPRFNTAGSNHMRPICKNSDFANEVKSTLSRAWWDGQSEEKFSRIMNLFDNFLEEESVSKAFYTGKRLKNYLNMNNGHEWCSPHDYEGEGTEIVRDLNMLCATC